MKPGQTSLGFADSPIDIGTHICLVFTSDEERKESLLKFLLSGLQQEEREACFSANITEEELRNYFQDYGISYDESRDGDQISLSGTSEVYFEDGCFDPDRMINNLTQFYNMSIEEGYESCRVIGEMIPEVEHVPGGERLLEYECRVTKLVRDHPITTICQYDARDFDGATILEIMKVHPKMFVNGAVINNPFFIDPDEYLKNRAANA